MPQDLDIEKLKMGVTHPTIHIDYYKWLEELKKNKSREFDFGFVMDHSKSFADFHAVAMFVWSQSREHLKRDSIKIQPTTPL